MSELATTTPQPRASALAVMASNLNVDPAKLLQTLKATVFRGASDDEILALVVISNTYGLNPILKEVYAFPAKGGGIVPVVSIDGWIRTIAQVREQNRRSALCIAAVVLGLVGYAIACFFQP